ncbi:MAG: 1-acyl-sn-glycerol-3-phosphate acyltransferase [Bacteroidales bacterium]|nr:1-acyl-sn-glycerol-3-phosphate acyltransferase [Bacteroidales bacterium]
MRGFTFVGQFPEGVKKSIVIEAPHTCMEDFVIGRCFFWMEGRDAKFLIKKEFFKFGLGWFLRKIGGIPVDRSRGNNMVVKTAAIFKQYDELNIVITPEGTRKRVKKWKRGFYYIAEMAQVPVVLGFIDYKTKRCGYGPSFIPSGDFDKDWPILENFYRGMQGKTPGKFNLE